VVRRELVGSAEVQNLAGTTALRKIAGIFYEGVPRFGELTVEIEGGLSGEVVRASECGPVESDLATERPIRREPARPGQLNGGVVAVARDGICSGREAEIEDRGEIEIATQWAELLLDSEGKVAEAGSRAGSNGEIVVVVGNGETKLCFGEKAVANAGFGKVEHELTLHVGYEKAILKLKATLGNDHAGIRDSRAVGRNDDLRIRNGLGMDRDGSQEKKRQESEVEVEPGAHVQVRLVKCWECSRQSKSTRPRRVAKRRAFQLARTEIRATRRNAPTR